MDVKDIQNVIDIEKVSKLKLKYGFNHRYHDSVIKAKELSIRKTRRYYQFEGLVW